MLSVFTPVPGDTNYTGDPFIIGGWDGVPYSPVVMVFNVRRRDPPLWQWRPCLASLRREDMNLRGLRTQWRAPVRARKPIKQCGSIRRHSVWVFCWWKEPFVPAFKTRWCQDEAGPRRIACGGRPLKNRRPGSLARRSGLFAFKTRKPPEGG